MESSTTEIKEKKHRFTPPHRLLTDTLWEKDNQERPETKHDVLGSTAKEASTKLAIQATKWNPYQKEPEKTEV